MINNKEECTKQSVEYTFTYNKEFNRLPERQLIGFVLPYAVTVPTSIIKRLRNGKLNKLSQVLANHMKENKFFINGLENTTSQDYASKLQTNKNFVGKSRNRSLW